MTVLTDTNRNGVDTEKMFATLDLIKAQPELGLFRFRADGSNERGLAVMKVAAGGGQPVAGSPKSFGT